MLPLTGGNAGSLARGGLTGQRRRKCALREALTGMDGNDGHGERHNQAADDQSCSSGKVQTVPNVFPTEERFPIGAFYNSCRP